MERTKNNTLPLDRMQELETYAMAWSSPVSEAVRSQVEKATASLAYVDMASGPMMRGLLGFLVRASKAQRVLEIGTFIGTSAMGMAEAMHDVRDRQAPQAHHAPYLLTIDKNKRYIELVKDAFAQEPYASIIESVEGDALAMLCAGDPRIFTPQRWDLIFLDGDKAHYPEYIEHVVELLRVGGVLVIDNVLWYGHVLDAETLAADKLASDTLASDTLASYPDAHKPNATREQKHKQKAVAIDQMNQRLAQDPRLTTQIFPFGDGLTLATRIQ
jgi:predicted O-methyltransferase YrrM